MSAVCPACGVAVVPGYVRCPRCHAALPIAAPRRNASTIDPGGTAVARNEFPRWLVWGGAIVAVVLVLYLLIGWISDAFSDYRSTAKKTGTPTATDGDSPATAPQGRQPNTPSPQTDNGNGSTQPNTLPPPQARVNPAAPAAELQAALRRQRLWSTVEVVGPRLDVRSSSCSDNAMTPVIEAARSALRNGGLTRLRCLEQSGRVVFERDL